ncbi:biotin synthase BioB [Haloimpatiens massiliensis]|uniref:biotin synthase BioB n=1 Tax=Haloimpatiens massiliensis TaxID=1658110 RepID=UPI000C859E47|nr:biotin synthase BioB [Haloimpatiens massiliensis]
MGFIKEMKDKIINGNELTFEEILEIYKNVEVQELFNVANEIRKSFMGNSIDLCTIMNAKCGKCSEDCKYCAQSAHYNTNIETHGLVNKQEVLKLAKNNEEEGVHRFSLVTSGKGLNGKEFEEILHIYAETKKNSKLKLCASLGILSYEQLKKLKEAGVCRYHHNVETSKRYFGSICTTHSYEDRISTIKLAQKAGLEVCSGGIIGMGENLEDRISMAFQLKKLNIKSIPINILNPIKGTPLEKSQRLSEEEILKTIAIFRLINKDAYIRLGGGRCFLNNFAEKAFEVGANATITGNYLTTSGNNISQDIHMLIKKGFDFER